MSLASVVCKLLHTLIRDHTIEFQKKINKYISKWVPNIKVMSNQSLIFCEEITKWVDDGSPVDIVYLIFRKLKIKCHIKDCYLN